MPRFKLNDNIITQSKKTRIYNCEVPVIGLTGGIATGKSTVSKILQDQGIPLIDADKLVKKVYNSKESLEFIKGINTSLISNNQINFMELRKVFFEDMTNKEKIENFILPKLKQLFEKDLSTLNSSFVIYDAPILYERELEKILDFVAVVYCPNKLQFERLIKRDNIDKDLAQKILNSQIDIEIKKNKADFVINNYGDLEVLKENIKLFIKKITV